MDLVLIHQLKIATVRRPEDWICDVPPDYLFYSLRDSLFYSDGREAEDILRIRLVLRVTGCVYLQFNSAIFNTGSFGGCSQRCKHILFLDMDR